MITKLPQLSHEEYVKYINRFPSFLRESFEEDYWSELDYSFTPFAVIRNIARRINEAIYAGRNIVSFHSLNLLENDVARFWFHLSHFFQDYYHLNLVPTTDRTTFAFFDMNTSFSNQYFGHHILVSLQNSPTIRIKD